MMRTLSVAVVTAMFLMLAPAGSAAESVTVDYTGSAGYMLGPFPGLPSPAPFSGRGLALVLCPNGCDLNEPPVCFNLDDDMDNGYETCVWPEGTMDPVGNPLPTVDPVGGAAIGASTTYNSAIIKPNDDIYGSGAAISACFYDPVGDSTCDPDPDDGDNDYQSDWVCGTVPLVGAPFSGDSITVWALTILVNEDLTTCGAVSGTLTVDFFNV